MQENLKRRHFLQWGAAGIGAALMSWKAGAANLCAQTPPQTAGPFYPGAAEFTANNDLTAVPGATAAALGQVIHIEGVVRDVQCKPIPGASVEIWQACASGRYNNDNDPNTAALDPNFKYWGETITAKDGSYSFKSILPGAYPADTDWDRPPHIHFKVAKRRYHDLITQMYFKGQPLNDLDKILAHVPAQLRSDVIVDFQPQPGDPTSLLGTFNITMLGV
jgi:protocatechuate 3,4-dioxygenase beta subunit